MHFSKFAKAFGGKAFEFKTAHYVGNYSGAALWLPPNVDPDVDALLGLLQETTSEEAQNVVPEVFEKMGGYHPSEPHWYLPLLGVDPHHHGKGLGSVLMKYALTMCDKDNSLSISRIIKFKKHSLLQTTWLRIARYDSSKKISPYLSNASQASVVSGINSNQYYNHAYYGEVLAISKYD